MTQRTQKIDELLRQEIGQALEREVTDPGLGFVTVTRVETSPDLSHARVWVSVIGPEEKRKASLAALRRAMPFIRHGLGAKIRLRRMPELEVRLDDSLERGTRVLHVLDELEAGRVPDEPEAGESLPTPLPRLPRAGDSEVAQEPAVPPMSLGKHAARPRPKGGRRGAAGGKRNGEAGSGPGSRGRGGAGSGRRTSRPGSSGGHSSPGEAT